MDTSHPSDLELFEFVEGELDETAAARISLHVDGCPLCAEAVALSAEGRDALRASPILELPESAARASRERLGPQERDPGKRRHWSPGRLVAVLAPVAAVAAAVVAVVVVTNGNNENAEKARPEVAAASAAPADTAAAADAATTAAATTANEGGATAADTGAAADSSSLESTAAPILVRKVTGPATAVVSLLVKAGLKATRTDQGVTVEGADSASVDRALDGRATGSIAVFVIPAP